MFQRGVTLIELMVVIAIVAILSGIAVPSFSQLVADTSLSSQVNGFMADARFARSEAMKRGVRVVLCPSANSHDINPTCGGAEWSVGWIAFVDTDKNNDRSADEPVLRRQESLPSSSSIAGVVGPSPLSYLRFNAEGRIVGLGANLKFTSSSTNSSVFPRLLCIPNTGRINVADRTATPACQS